MRDAAELCVRRLGGPGPRPLLVGIGGDSGSGKSHLAADVTGALTAQGWTWSLLNHDEFLIPRADREPLKGSFYREGRFAGRSRWEVLENWFRLEEFRRVLHELRGGREVAFHPYSRTTGDVGEGLRTVTPAEFVVVDTSVLLTEMDVVVVVEVAQETLVERKLVRDADLRSPAEIADMHRRVQGFFWAERGRPAHPDLVVDNDDMACVVVHRPG